MTASPSATPTARWRSAELDLEIRDGEFLVLVGPSGCGKTTALRMAAGLEEISGGRLLVGDRVVNDVHPAERDIAMVFQNYALYPHMSVRENMAFPLSCAGVSKEEAKGRVERAAEALGLTEYLHRKPKALSGGQRQRVAMGRAIVRKPQAFLMDEPLSNLDAKLRGQMRAEIRKLQREYETTTLYVTHDQVEAMTMGDRIAVLRKGVLQQLGTPEELYEAPANLFVAEFLGSPPMNIVRATVTRTAEGLQLVVGSQRLHLADGQHSTPSRPWRVPTRSRSRSACGRNACRTPRPPTLACPAWWPTSTSSRRCRRRSWCTCGWTPSRSSPRSRWRSPRTPTRRRPTSCASSARASALQARLPGTSTVREGTRAEFAIDPSALHFFDLASGEAIASGHSLAGAAR